MSPKDPIKVAAYNKAYYYGHLDYFREFHRAYYPKNRDKLIAAATLWAKEHPEQRLAKERRYKPQWRKEHPELFHAEWSRQRSKRRALGFDPLNLPFDGCAAHHINQTDVVYIPQELHRSISHNVWTGRGMAEINAKALAWYTEDWT